MDSESFWETPDEAMEQQEINTGKQNDIKINDHLFLIPKSISELEKAAIKARTQLEHIEILRAEQINQLFLIENEYAKYSNPTQYNEYEKMLKKVGKIGYVVNPVMDSKVIQIKMDFLLPIYHKTKNVKLAYYNALQEIYQRELIKLLVEKRNDLPNFAKSEKVFVLIVQHFNNNIPTDLDNRFHSFIFNALKNSLITPDDKWQRLSYMEEGRRTSGKPYTDIYIGERKDLESIISISQRSDIVD